MSVTAFTAYTLCVLLAFAAQLAFALREWRSLRRREPMFVDQLYVRVERYFGVAFRQKLDGWLQLPSRQVAPDVRVIDKQHEQIWVYESLALPAGARFDGIIVADSLETGPECRLLREAYTRGDCRLGPGNVIQALAADGAASLGRGTQVIRWVDAAGELVIEPDCRVSGRATSARRLVIHAGATVASAHAPLVVAVAETPDEERGPLLEPPDERPVLGGGDEAWAAVGAPGRRRRLAEDCIAYDGDLTLPAVRIESNIVVRGNLVVGAQSVIHGDVKATGSIEIGPHADCHGSLVAGGDVRLAAEVTFRKVVFAEGSIDIGRRASGVQAHPGVAVYAAKVVVLRPGVTVRGKVSAGEHVIVSGS